MNEYLTIQAARIASLADFAAQCQQAADAHAHVLHIDHDRMLSDFGLLWMLARCSLRLARLPIDGARLTTCLRVPASSYSMRDLALEDAHGVCGRAAQLWVLADAKTRRLTPIRRLSLALSTPQPEREEIPPRLVPNGPMTPAARWTVQPEEIDANGHLNNVHYIRHAQALVRADATAMDIVFSHECFAGETLTLQTGGDGFVRGVKETGKESFCARFLEGVTL